MHRFALSMVARSSSRPPSALQASLLQPVSFWFRFAIRKLSRPTGRLILAYRRSAFVLCPIFTLSFRRAPFVPLTNRRSLFALCIIVFFSDTLLSSLRALSEPSPVVILSPLFAHLIPSPTDVFPCPVQYPIPLPKGGREGKQSDPILREDQLPSRIRHGLGPRKKKGVSTDRLLSSKQ